MPVNYFFLKILAYKIVRVFSKPFGELKKPVRR